MRPPNSSDPNINQIYNLLKQIYINLYKFSDAFNPDKKQAMAGLSAKHCSESADPSSMRAHTEASQQREFDPCTQASFVRVVKDTELENEKKTTLQRYV